MGNQNLRQRVESQVEDFSDVRKFSSFSYSDTRLNPGRSPRKGSEQSTGQTSGRQPSEEANTEYSEFGSGVSLCNNDDEDEDGTRILTPGDDEEQDNPGFMESVLERMDEEHESMDAIHGSIDIAHCSIDTVHGSIDTVHGSIDAPHVPVTQEKKQVIIVDANPSPSRRRRSTFQRQDTPIHPEMVTLKPGKRPNILKSLSAQNSVPGNSLPVTPFCCRSSSCDTRTFIQPPPPLGASPANRLRNTNNLNTSISSTSNSGTTSPPSFVCSVDYAESPVPSPSEEQFVEDEFAIFVKASIHPPNELSVPRCYPDASTRVLVEPQAAANNQKNYLRSKSVSSPYAPGRSLISQRSLGSPGSRPSSPRPRLRRESAQEIEDGDYTPGASLEPGADRQFKQPGSIGTKGLSVYNHQVPRCPSPLLQPRLPLHRSAPGTPSTHFSVPRSSRSPCRTPSDESYLKVPYIRTRGTSLPESMEDSISDNLYLLRQFNIRGKKVVHVGDSFQTRARSNSSVNSNFSGGTGGQSQYSSRTGSCISSMENYSSTEDEPSIISNDQIQTFRVLILGGSGVGKSSLLNKFLSGNFSNTLDLYPESERGEKSVCIQLEDIECELVFIDRPRTEISAENLLSSYSADCAVVVFSVTDDGSLQEAREVLNILWQSGSLASRAVILVGNKTDLVRTRTVPIDEARSIASSHDCKYCEVSAALDHNVDSLLVGIVKQIHLKLFSHLQTKRSKGRLYTRRKSAGVRMRGIIDKVLRVEPKSKSCDDLNVL